MKRFRHFVVALLIASGCTSPPPGGGGGSSAGRQLDTDGDGFTDYDETAYTPGTDPNDPTDNPNNVRDTDSDGCSDYDEITFEGFCDNDPRTEAEEEVPPPSDIEPPPAENPAPNPADVIEDVQAATWLVIWSDTIELEVATAFGVAGDLLATNAHVVEAIETAFRSSPDAVAGVVQHETGEYRIVVEVWSHPNYDSTASGFSTPDVGLLRVDQQITDTLTMENERSLHDLQVLDPVSACGFPGDVTVGIDINGIFDGDFRPRATCLPGNISALRPLNESVAATPQNTVLIQHDLPTTPGMSGSAVVNEAGNVVAVHVGGFQTGGDYKFGIRVDMLKEFMDSATDGSLSGSVLAEIVPVEPEPPLPPLPLVPPVTNMDILRAACWFISDADILANVTLVDGFWWAGYPYEAVLADNLTGCDYNFDCVTCWNTVTDFVYFFAH